MLVEVPTSDCDGVQPMTKHLDRIPSNFFSYQWFSNMFLLNRWHNSNGLGDPRRYCRLLRVRLLNFSWFHPIRLSWVLPRRRQHESCIRILKHHLHTRGGNPMREISIYSEWLMHQASYLRYSIPKCFWKLLIQNKTDTSQGPMS